MDRQGGGGGGGGGDGYGNSQPFHYKHSRVLPSSRTFSDSSSMNPHHYHHRGSPNDAYRGPRDLQAFDDSPLPVDSERSRSSYERPPPPSPLSGQKRPFSSSDRSGSPERLDGGGFAKLFVGSVPRTATEEDIQPLFEEQGRVLEVAFIKDKRTGQQQGCCFIKYATSAEADRAIRALHNQYTLPGGIGPIQVRYADGERERLGAVEYKLFVGSLNKQATEKEVEQIFSPYGRVEDVYLMRDDTKQSRGCGFVKYSHRDMAMAAISSLSGKYTMMGCEQPLTVRFADPKRPKPGEPRGGGPAFGGPGFSTPGIRPLPNIDEPLGDRIGPNSRHSAESVGPVSNQGMLGFGKQFPPRSTDTAEPLTLGRSSRSVSGTGNGLVTGLGTCCAPTSQLLQPPASTHLSHGQASSGAVQSAFNQAMSPIKQSLGLTGQSNVSQPQVQCNAVGHTPLNNIMQIHVTANQQSPVQPHLHQPPSQLAQMLSQQTQTLQASFQSSRQTFTQLQQQLQLMQPANQSSELQQGSQEAKSLSPWPLLQPKADALAATSAPCGTNQITGPVKCNWTEHTSPDGFKYYYNSTSGESRWEKPEELISYEQQQNLSVQYPHIQAHLLGFPSQQIRQMQPQLQSQLPSHIQTQINTQQLQEASPYPVGVTGQQQSIQGTQAAQEWMWKSKPAGA